MGVGEDFKINIYFNENGEELEKIIANFLANTLKDNLTLCQVHK